MLCHVILHPSHTKLSLSVIMRHLQNKTQHQIIQPTLEYLVYQYMVHHNVIYIMWAAM